MGHRKDELILELLKDKVLEKDRQLERNEIHKATKEALAELTALSQTEVDQIYRDVVAEVETKQKAKRKYILIILILTGVVSAISLPFILKKTIPPERFVDEFDDNFNQWSFNNTYLSQSYSDYPDFVVDSKEDEKSVHQVDQLFDFPDNYSIETQVRLSISTHTKGYGIYLSFNDNTFAYFFLRSDQYYRYGICNNGKWLTEFAWTADSAISPDSLFYNNLKVEKKANNFIFSVNGKVLIKDDFLGLKPKNYSFAVVGTQTARYKNLNIVNIDKKDTLYAVNFDNPDNIWKDNRRYKKFGIIKDGKYAISVDKKDYCFWASSWMPTKFSEFDYSIDLNAFSTSKPKDDNYGLMLMYDDENYFSFEIKNNSSARIIVHNGKEYTHLGTYKDFKSIRDTVKLHIEKVKGTLTYFVNGTKVDIVDRESMYKPDINKVALRVCDSQTVEFDKLVITEIK